MQYQEIKNKVLSVISKIIEIDEGKINLDTNFFENELLDSLDFVQLIANLSDEFNLDITPAQIERNEWDSTSKIIKYIFERINK